MQDFEIVFFEKADGTEPAKDFIESLDIKMRAKMLKTVMLLAHNGTDLREPYSKYLGDNIFELRAKVGSDVSRVLYFFSSGAGQPSRTDLSRNRRRPHRLRSNWRSVSAPNSSAERRTNDDQIQQLS